MAPRPKKPTTQELIEELQERLERLENKQEEDVKGLKEESQTSVTSLTEKISENENKIEKLQEMQEESTNKQESDFDALSQENSSNISTAMEKISANEEAIEKIHGKMEESNQKQESYQETFKEENESYIEKICEQVSTNKETIEQIHEKMEESEKNHENNMNISKEENESRFNSITETFSANDKRNQLLQEQLEELEKKQAEDFNSINIGLTTSNNETLAKFEATEESTDNLKEHVKDTEKKQENSINQLKEEIQQSIADVKENFMCEIDDLRSINDQVSEKLSMNQNNTCDELSSSKELMMTEINSVKDGVEFLGNRVEEISEKMYDFEINKRNNLIFYGVPNENRETPSVLLQKVITIIKTTLMLRREIVITKASRILTGPEVSGYRPVLVTFEEFKDREDILNKANMISRTSSIHITEDMSRRVRESQTELRKYLRQVKRNNPSASCFLQYDKLYIDQKPYIFNDLQGKVVELHQDFGDGMETRPGSVMMNDHPTRPGSVMMDDYSHSSLSFRSIPSSPVKKYSASSPLQRTQSLYLDVEKDEREAKITELEEVIKRQKDKEDEALKREDETQARMKEMEEVMEMLRNKLAQCEED